MNQTVSGLSFNGRQALDLHLCCRPDRPLVICVHGGGFVSGSRDDPRCLQAVSILLDAGFNAASVSYSLASPDDRFGAWPQNLLDIADAVAWLETAAEFYGYAFDRAGMLGFSAGCCLCNVYIQGGRDILERFGSGAAPKAVAALVGFYGPYDFPSRQAARKSTNQELNQLHSPSFWINQVSDRAHPPVLHIQGDRDDVVYPDQHRRFEADYRRAGGSFEGITARGFGHSFKPRDVNEAGESLDLAPRITAFFTRHLCGG